MLGKLLCLFRLHDYGKWEWQEVFHSGEYPWDTWTHLCHAMMRGPCSRCGYESRRKKRKCSGPHYAGPRQTRDGYDFTGLPEENIKLFEGRI